MQTSLPFDPARTAPPPAVERKPVAASKRVCLYFAYGSNICLDQMRRRCPSARPLGVAVLPYHGLAFAGFSTSWGGAVAHVVPHPEREVPGVIYELNVADLRALDRAEGVPLAYRRTLRRVVDETGAEHVVHVYLHQSTEPGTPTEEYLRQILRGYQRHGIDLDRMLAAMGVANDHTDRAPAEPPRRRGPSTPKKSRRRDLRRPIRMHENDPTMTHLRPIFVYGSLRKGFGNHYLLANASFDGEARTSAGFRLYDLGPYPGMIATGLRGGTVAGEIYLVGDRTLARVDRLEGHPRFYCRMPIRLATGREVETYLIRLDLVEGREIVPNGDWTEYVEQRLVTAATRQA